MTVGRNRTSRARLVARLDAELGDDHVEVAALERRERSCSSPCHGLTRAHRRDLDRAPVESPSRRPALIELPLHEDVLVDDPGAD